MSLCSIARQGEQLGDGGEIPVRVLRLGMAHESRQCRQVSLHVVTGAVPGDQRVDGEGMTKAMRSRPALSRRRFWLQSGGTGQGDEGGIEGALAALRV